MDLKIMSTIGMTKEDVSAIRQVDGVAGVYGSYSMDVLNTHNNQQRVYKLLSYPMNAKAEDENYINQMRLIKGGFPGKRMNASSNTPTSREQIPESENDNLCERYGRKTGCVIKALNL